MGNEEIGYTVVASRIFPHGMTTFLHFIIYISYFLHFFHFIDLTAIVVLCVYANCSIWAPCAGLPIYPAVSANR